ncbi:MAG: hypothetical protein HY718_00580 [Planctomycetes bacterium]|nr:hypothetical protein [Planctomycetota bacterium]
MRNTGTTTWTRAAEYKLGEQGTSPLIAPGRIELTDRDAIAPDQEKTFNFTITAPIATGYFTITFQMVQEHIEWFGAAHSPPVQVTFGPNPPAAPTITWPAAGMTLGSNSPDITWTTVPIDAYEVHIGSANTPSSADGWNSGIVYLSSLTDTAMSGPLVPQRWYYVFVRLHNANGWGPWSEQSHWFYVSAELVNDPYFVAGVVGAQRQHAMCYNPDRNEYLICYFDSGKGKPSVISYYRLDAAGARIGAEGWIVDDLEGAGGPHVCYNSARREYLIAYGGYTASGGLHDELRVQRINAENGALIGMSNWITSLPGAFNSNVAYSPTSDSYLLVWDSGYDHPNPLYARRLDSTAVPVGSTFHASTAPYVWAGNPSIAWNSASNEFLVTFQAYYETEPLTWWDYYAQRVRASDGAMLGSNITISATPDYDSNGDVAYDPDMNRYLVIYDGGSPTPWLQFLSAAGALEGPRFPATPDTFYNGGMSAIAWNPVTKEYLATWAHCCSASNFGRRLSETGAYIGEPFRTNGDVVGFGNWDPMTVVNTVSGEFLIYWFWQYDNIYVRRYRTYPLPAPDTQPPGPVTGLMLTRAGGSMGLNWTNPATSDFSATMIRVKVGSPPTGLTDGKLVVEKGNAPGTTDSFTDTGRPRGTLLCYAAFAHDLTLNYAAAATACGMLVAGDFDGDTDVDQEDYGHFQQCLSDQGLPYGEGCADADLDDDGDVDSVDLNLFRTCQGAADQPPGC